MNRSRLAWLLVAALALVACHPAGAPDAGVDAGEPVIDAGPPPLPELTVTLQFAPPDAGSPDGGVSDAGVVAIADAGTASETVELRLGERPTIPPVQDLTVLVNRGLQNARIRILDEADRVVASDEKLDVRANAIRDDVHFVEPLESGHKYVLVLDAQNGPDILDERGQHILGQRLEFATSGPRAAPVKPTPPKKTKRRRRRR